MLVIEELPQAGRQAGRHIALVYHISSLIFHRTLDLIRDFDSYPNSGKLVNTREGEKIGVRRGTGGGGGGGVGGYVQCCKVVRGKAAEKCGLG